MEQKSPSLSPLSANVYRLLLQEHSLTVHEIASKLRIFPHAIYRNVKQLEALGCIYHTGKYPARYLAKQPLESVETYLLSYRDWFFKMFGMTGVSNGIVCDRQDAMPNIEFIESRAAMFEKAIKDVQRTKKDLHLIVSGDESPADIILEEKWAMERGVSIRILVQKRNAQNEDMLTNWKRMGMKIRICPPVNIRVSIYDTDVVYFMSYHPENIGSSTGVRFEYGPFARLMLSVFNNLWKDAKVFP